jgi:ATP-binding cassette subfamily B protein
MKFTFVRQLDKMDCGPVCLQMIAKHYGRNTTLHDLRNICDLGKEGVSLLGIKNGARQLGFEGEGVHVTIDDLYSRKLFPIILYWNQDHFVVLYNIRKKGNRFLFYIADPARDKCRLEKKAFLLHWMGENAQAADKGFGLYLEPGPGFHSNRVAAPVPGPLPFAMVWKEMLAHRKVLVRTLLAIAITLGIQVLLPFITKTMADQGINGGNPSLVIMLLTAQFVFLVSKSLIVFFRNWTVLYIGAQVNIKLVSSYLYKLLRLPTVYFDRKNSGDIIQSINDNGRVEDFLTTHISELIISVIGLLVFEIILLAFDARIFFFFLAVSIVYACWIRYMLQKRKNIDYERFDCASKNQSFMIQLVNGVQDIKLSNAITKKIGDWNQLQESLFKYNQKNLLLKQINDLGSVFLLDLAGIAITGYVAISVINREMTLGQFIALQYILAQVIIPIQALVQFFKAMNDTRLSLRRIGDLDNYEMEKKEQSYKKTDLLHLESDIRIKNLSFSYPGSMEKRVLKDVTVTIKKGQVNAIVGTSGSGKTTFIKLLLKMYTPQKGTIMVGNRDLNHINFDQWRTITGAVMQDGYIFSDSILNNIVMKGEEINRDLFRQAADIANIKGFVDELPHQFNTRIGMDGTGLSQGQKQRLLIARCIYKDPLYFIFDEATNSLDAINERTIYNNLNNYYAGKTVIIIAHRLSTIKNADQIIVFHEGRVVETGTHYDLYNLQGYYHSLVVNQLENSGLVND